MTEINHVAAATMPDVASFDELMDDICHYAPDEILPEMVHYTILALAGFVREETGRSRRVDIACFGQFSRGVDGQLRFDETNDPDCDDDA